MKTSKKLILTFLASTMFSFSSVFAAWIDHFEVQLSPNTAEVGEAVDLTIEAVDKNNTVIKDYDGTILIFSESDPEAELPSALEENTYTYSLSDEWVIKFENAVKFKNAWTQNIHIYDLNDDTVFWIAEAEINEATILQNVDIEIVSPENWLTIWENKIWISWTTQKNHQIKIIVNNEDEIKTTSNDNGAFEIDVENLRDWDNLIKAQVLDADSNIIWESEEISIKVDINSLNVKNIKVTPESVDPENSFEIEVVTNPKLDSVQIILNDVITDLEEISDWVYSAKTYAPKEPGTYKIDVKVKDELGHEKTEIWSTSITVNEVELEAATEEKEKVKIIKTEVINEDVNTKNNKKDLKITWLKLVELKTKSILSWDAIEWADSYNIYKKLDDSKLELVTNVKTTTFEIPIANQELKYDYFAVKAVSKTNSWEVYEWSLSEATKVKTGPELIILFLLSLFIGWIFLFIKQKQA
jgi:hypothetical protein